MSAAAQNSTLQFHHLGLAAKDADKSRRNAPVNSPAPDHIFLFRAPEELADMISNEGFEILDTYFAPATGSTRERARSDKLTISAVVIASLPARLS